MKFDGTEYYINGGYNRKSSPYSLLSHDIWNCYNPDNPVKEGEVVHHINKNPLDDRIENLEKMTCGEHSTLHNMGVNRSKENKLKHKQLRLGGGTPELRHYYTIYQEINSLGIIGSSGFNPLIRGDQLG